MMYSFNGEEHHVDDDLASNLDTLNTMVHKDWDGLLFVFGREGVGKSTFALQCAAYLDKTFSVEKIAWTPQQFLEKVKHARQYDCIVLDEAYLTFTNAKRMDLLQRTIIGMLTMIRSKNLFIIIVCPTFFDLSKYLVVHRSIAAFRCYHVELQRGFFEMYDENAKLQLYIKGRKDNNIHAFPATLHGRFTKWFPIDKAEYDKRKNDAVSTLAKELEKTEKVYDLGLYRDGQDEVLLYFRDVAEVFKRGEMRGLWMKVSAHLGITPEALHSRVSKYKKMREKKQNAMKGGLYNTLIPTNDLVKNDDGDKEETNIA